ncbi:putative membrane protein [Microbacteriaceae bacterium SG_E_30_P1]|uniref:Membrane protein n=1 Tax=Antiquaquibacter oligotrophicus TaxID=2880260 RepID=A0ABT6KLF2_9MICO|nr:DUF1622 domain-containing protein [Antiquaquibacter oligotrophicus]MDH6180278.1 putative membrane protein [Antiquaquibacter oligotrophicus]UDF13975.1 DUF1622 domain-containing protein [Antiquaquibacter oligotrophicus]
MEVFFETVTRSFEVAGVAAMVVGFVVSVVLGIRTWRRSRDGHRAFTTLRDSIGLSILLGLEILVAADLVRTVTSTPSLTDAVILAIIVLIRTVLSFSLQVEIEGVAPWKRALMTAPQQIVARAASRSARERADAEREKEE